MKASRFLNIALLSMSIPDWAVAQEGLGALTANEPCAGIREAERRHHDATRAEIANRRMDSDGQLERERIACREERACLDRALAAHGRRERQLQMDDEKEIARHAKAYRDIDRGKCVAPSSDSACAETALADLTALLGQILPHSDSATPIKGKLLFLKLTPPTRDWLMDQLQETTQSIAAGQNSKSLSTHASALRQTIRELRLRYDAVKRELGAKAAMFPESSQLNFPD